MRDSLRRPLRVLRRNAWLIAAVTVLFVGVAGWRSATRAPQYRATAMLPLVGDAGVPAPGSREVLGDAVDLAGLRLFSEASSAPAAIAEDVRVWLPAEETSVVQLEFRADRIAYGPQGALGAAYGEPVLLQGAEFVVPSRPPESSASFHLVTRDAAIDHLAERVEWRPDPAAGAVEVRVVASDPRIASRAVQAISAVYGQAEDRSAPQRVETTRRSLEEDLRETSLRIVLAEGELQALRDLARRTRLGAELEGWYRYLDGVARAGEAGRVPGLPAGASPGVRSLHGRLSDLVTQRAALWAGPGAPGPGHPDVQRLTALIADTRESLIGATRGRIRSLQAQIEALGPVETPATVGGTPADTVAAAREIEALRTQAAELAGRLRTADVDTVPAPRVPVEAAVEVEPVRSGSPYEIPLALAVGILVGVGAAVVRERSGPGEGTPGAAGADEPQAEELDPVPTLAVIPEVTPSLVAPRSGDFRPGPRQSAGIDAYGTLRNGLLARSWGLKTLVVTSASPGEGKTTTSTNLAAIYARRGLKVVVIECDLRRPSLGRYFEISRDLDLVDVLFEGVDWRRALQLTQTPGLYVLLGEKSFPRAGESLGGPEMKRLLSEITREYDLVILDTSPLLVSEDALVLGPIVDGVLLVVRASRTEPATVDEVVERLRDAGATVVGTVLNDPDGAADRWLESAAS